MANTQVQTAAFRDELTGGLQVTHHASRNMACSLTNLQSQTGDSALTDAECNIK